MRKVQTALWLNWERYSVIFLVILGVVDQATKFLAFRSEFGGFFNSFKPVLSKQLLGNPNFAFGLRMPHILMYLILFGLIVWLFVYYSEQTYRPFYRSLGLGLIITGAVSNLVDRIFLGYVRDFIYIFWGSVFNLADVYIILGILLILYEKKFRFIKP